MLPKGSSTTRSSKSATSKSTGQASKVEGPATPVQFVKGVGPKLGAVLESRGIATVRDLLTFFPRAYEDRSKILKIVELQEGVRASVALRVVSARKIPLRGRSQSMLEVRCTDESQTLLLKWFHSPWGLAEKFVPGAQLIATGLVKSFMERREMLHPEISWGNALALDVGRIVPIYTELDGVPSRTFRKILWEAVQKYASTMPEDIPAHLRAKHKLPPIASAIRDLHFPPEKGDVAALVEFRAPAQQRLIYEEFFKFEYLVLKRRLKMERAAADAYGSRGGRDAAKDLENALPFTLTGAQRDALREILDDLGQKHPMNRLVQGDVGSGKTAVAFLAAGAVLAEGGQAALMAPTEILAEQHFRTVTKLFGGKLRAALITGKTPAGERAAILGPLAAGQPTLLIGTHALIEDPVEFKNLALVMIDEQHRFGVEQRRILRSKGERSAGGRRVLPHGLVLTATPIPRTLALTAYGDLSVSTLRELPPGRSPILTKVIRGRDRARAYATIRREIEGGRQSYFICPLVNDSEAEGFTELRSAVTQADRLKQEFPEFKIGLLHGQLRPDEKAEVMAAFQRKEIQILVSTTVVEVGVDVPNATVMAIEHSERFGLSQLHQLRGRVGRGIAQSYCFLLTESAASEAAKFRLEVLEETTDGFKIAEADLQLRGPGEFLGVRQAGGLPFRVADLVRDADWLQKAREDALEVLKVDGDLQTLENASLRIYLEKEGHIQSERLQTS